LHASPEFKDRNALQTFWVCSQHVEAQSESAEHAPVMNWLPGETEPAWPGARPSLQAWPVLKEKKALQMF
jgi:hypothetical protein